LYGCIWPQRRDRDSGRDSGDGSVRGHDVLSLRTVRPGWRPGMAACITMVKRNQLADSPSCMNDISGM